MSLIDTISQIKNKDGKNGVFKRENPQVSSRFINMGKLLSRNGINNKLFENNSKPTKNTYNTDINADKISNIVSADKKYMINDISVGDTNKINHINPIKNIVSSYDNKSISKGSFTPDYKPLKISPSVNPTKLPTKVNNTNTFTNNKGLTPVTHNVPLASSFKFDEKNNDNKELLDEMKTQTKIQRDILVEIRKNSDDSKGLLEFVDDFKKKKKIPSPKGPKPSLLKRVSDGVSKAKNILKNAGEKTLTKLGGLADKSKSIIKTTANIAKNAAAKGMTSSALATGAKVLSKAVPVAAAVGTGWEVGQAIGGSIYEKYQNTDFMKGVGATVAKVGAFFGNKEAKEAVAFNEKYDANKYKDFGSVAAKYESKGDAGTISTGHGDAGGKSYGKFQLASKKGNVDKFIKESGYSEQFKGLTVGSSEFDAKWKELAKTDKNFDKAQTDYIAKTHYQPLLNKLKKDGIDLSNRGKAVQEMIMSTGVQYGGGTSVLTKALKGKDIKNMSDEEIIKASMEYKKQTVSNYFSKNSSDVQAGVANRFSKEEQLLLKIAQDEKSNKQESKVASNTPVTKDNKETKVASNTPVSKDNKDTKVAVDSNKGTIIDSIIDKPVSVINDNIKPNNKLENYQVKYTNTLMPDNDINNTDSTNVSKKEMEKLSNNKIAINQGAMRASSTQGPAPTAQSSKQDELTPNIEVRNQTSTIQRVFDRDANLII